MFEFTYTASGFGQETDQVEGNEKGFVVWIHPRHIACVEDVDDGVLITMSSGEWFIGAGSAREIVAIVKEQR
jgi:uncharacterized protein YlzI (FlbEa/FlbD family)